MQLEIYHWDWEWFKSFKFHDYGIIYKAFVVLSLISILIYIKIIPEDKILKKEV